MIPSDFHCGLGCFGFMETTNQLQNAVRNRICEQAAAIVTARKS